MKNNPVVSVIVPSFNFEKYIGKCLESILQQTYRNLELIVVNDGSTDNTKAIIDTIASRDKRVKVIHKSNEGVSVARNIGLKQSHGKYVCFVDADDFLSPDFVEYMVNMAQSTNSDFCVSTQCFTKKNEIQSSNITIHYLDSEQATILLLSPAVIVGCWNKLFKRDILIDNKIGFSPDLFYGEGLRFITQVAQSCKKIAVTNRKMYYYRRNNYFSATSKFNIEKFKNGFYSLNEIESTLKINTPNVNTMLGWHKCQFKMGTVVRILEANKKKENIEYYKESLKYVRRNFYKYLFAQNISLFKRCLLLGCAINPYIMALLDKYRRINIAKSSIE